MGNSTLQISNKNKIIYTFLKSNYVKFLIRKRILWLALKAYKNPVIAFRCLKKIVKKREKIMGGIKITRYVYANDQYFYGLNAPGFPTKAFDLFIENELNNVERFKEIPFRLQTIIFSITKKCPLKCKHCFEWERVNKPETHSFNNLKTILETFQNRGVSQVQLSGGEPLSRMDDLSQLLKSAQSGTDFWVLTSGYNLTEENTIKLKQAGVSGINISLDHWQAEYHNKFRGNDNSFQWVLDGAKNTINADLALCFSICAIKDFISEENLMKYVEFAGELGAGFIQILEPRKVGQFSDIDIELERSHTDILDNFFLKMNKEKRYSKLPIVMFPGFHQRRSGCLGAGLRYLYIDSKANAHACPFCQEESGNVLTDPIDIILDKLIKKSCHKFKIAVEL